MDYPLSLSDSDTIPTVYFAEVEYRYQPVTGVLNVSASCLDFYQDQQNRLTQVQVSATETLNIAFHEAMAKRMSDGCYQYADVPFSVDIDITFIPQLFETSLANIGSPILPQFRQVCFVFVCFQHSVALVLKYINLHKKKVCYTKPKKTVLTQISLIGPHKANLVLIAYVSSKGSGEPAHLRSLARTSAARSYKQWVKRNLQTESQIPTPSEWLRMRS